MCEASLQQLGAIHFWEEEASPVRLGCGSLPVAVGKYSDQNSLREEGFILAHTWLRDTIPRGGEIKATSTDHMTFTF